jgi:hypothetical protein
MGFSRMRSGRFKEILKFQKENETRSGGEDGLEDSREY